MSKDNKLSARILALDNKTNLDIVDYGLEATGHMTDAHLGEKPLFGGIGGRLLSELPNQTRTLASAQTVVLRSDAMRAHPRFSNKCLFCHVYRRLSTLLAIKM